MLEKAATWSERESILRAELEGKTLIGQVNLSTEDLETLGKEIEAELEKRGEDEACRFLKANASLSTSAFLVWCGIRHYNAGNFWGGVYRLLGLEKENQGRKLRIARLLGEVFQHALEAHKLESFPRLAEHGHRYVTPILAHGGIPDYCLGDFFEHFIIPMTQGLYGDDPEDIDAAIRGFQGKYRSALTDKPVRNFLLYGGSISKDLVRRCGKMASRYAERLEVLEPHKLHLPPAVVTAFYEHVKGRSFDKRTKRRKAQPRPKIFLLPFEETIMLHIPETEIDLPAGKDVNCGKLFYSVRSGESELHVSRVGIGRYLGDKVLLDERMIPLPGPFPSLTVTLCDLESQEEVFERELDFLDKSTGDESEENSSLPYLVFGEEDDEGLCRFTGDTVKTTECWLVKKRDAHMVDEVPVLEEVALHGEGWSGFHALHLSIKGKDFLTLSDERAGVTTRIPVRLDLQEQVRVRKSGLIPEATWAGKPVYNHPPVLEFPLLQEPERLVLELEDGDGHPLGEHSLVEVARKSKEALLVDLGELEPLKDGGRGLYRCIIAGKLGERMDLDFACIPGLSVDFGEQGRYPDSDGRAFPLEAVINCPQAEEARAEGIIELQTEEETDGAKRVRIPPHETAITVRLQFGEEEIPLRVRIPRFSFRIGNGEQKAGQTEYFPEHAENGNADVEGTPLKTGAERNDSLGDLHTSLLQIRLEDLEPYGRLEAFLPRPCREVKLYLEGHDVSSIFPRCSRSVRFELGKFKGFMHGESSPSFRFRLKVTDEEGADTDFPILTVRKGWAVINLQREAKGGVLRLQWEEDGSRSLEGEVLLKNLFRPWEEPSSVRVKVGENTCAIPIPGGSTARGRFAVCFRLLDEWEWDMPRLPFQLPTDAYKEYFYLDLQRIVPSYTITEIYRELERATESLFWTLPNWREEKRALVFEGIKDDSPEEEVRAALLTYLYWQTAFGGHHREVEDRLCDAVIGWASVRNREPQLIGILDELEDLGGKQVANGMESLRLRLQPEKFEPAFYPGERLRLTNSNRIFEYLGVITSVEHGRTKRMMKMIDIEETAKGKRGRNKRTSNKSCSPCISFFPIDMYVEFEPYED